MCPDRSISYLNTQSFLMPALYNIQNFVQSVAEAHQDLRVWPGVLPVCCTLDHEQETRQVIHVVSTSMGTQAEGSNAFVKRKHVRLPLSFEFSDKTCNLLFGKQVQISIDCLLKSVLFLFNLFATASLYLVPKAWELQVRCLCVILEGEELFLFFYKCSLVNIKGTEIPRAIFLKRILLK